MIGPQNRDSQHEKHDHVFSRALPLQIPPKMQTSPDDDEELRLFCSSCNVEPLYDTMSDVQCGTASGFIVMLCRNHNVMLWRNHNAMLCRIHNVMLCRCHNVMKWCWPGITTCNLKWDEKIQHVKIKAIEFGRQCYITYVLFKSAYWTNMSWKRTHCVVKIDKRIYCEVWMERIVVCVHSTRTFVQWLIWL